MKKDKIAIAAIACLMVISLSTFALLRVQFAESANIQYEKNDTDVNRVANDPANQQTLNSTTKQTPRSDVVKNIHQVDDQCRIQDEQTLNQNEPTKWPTEANQNQISQSPVPFPDGRIFLHASTGTEDAIPYIPTEYPKTSITAPLVPLELDN